MNTETFAAVRACSILLLADVVLHAEGVTAGKGKVIDWRTTKSGEVIQEGADTFDTAQLFVAIVGPSAALGAAMRDQDIANAPEVPEPGPHITAFAVRQNGCRLREFEVGSLRIQVERLSWIDGDDGEVAQFTERLAALAVTL